MDLPPITDDPIRAARGLADGQVVAFPTETVYGLGADAENDAACARVFAIKRRPRTHPMIVHGHDASLLERYGRDVPASAYVLAEAFWPGPLTLLVWRGPRVSQVAVAGSDRVGLRVPDHRKARDMLFAFGRGVAGPSANRFGRTSPTTAAHVASDLGFDVDLVLDGGQSTVGVESTIVDLTGNAPMLLREGGVPRAVLAETIGREIVDGTGGPSRAPGMMSSHYAPATPLEAVEPHDAAKRIAEHSAAGRSVALISHVAPQDGVDVHFRPADGVDGYAHDLYRLIREADGAGADVIIAVLPKADGRGAAVRDRLRRAARR